MTSGKAPFWQSKKLSEMSGEEWEQLCDGCGQCCLIKLEDEDTLELAYTRVACEFLDIASCRCTDYAHRTARIPGCLDLTPEAVATLGWLPETCAYRLIGEGRPLPSWHPLNSGRRESVHEAGISVRGFAIGEEGIDEDDLQDHILIRPGTDRGWK
ncbi:MAG: YcgN family cysteine cluster protein [Rhodobiaceae bacterium]|nr:YcgN family cysteine cluster protein [Rhodobiaceae bacterium]